MIEQALDVLLANARIDAENSAAADTRLISAMSAWSSCFKAAGFQFTDTNQATDAGYSSGDVASADEIRQAAADAICRKSVQLFQVISKVTWIYEQKFVEANPGIVEEYASQLRATEDRALLIVQKAG